MTIHSDSEFQSRISEGEDLDLRLQMLIAEARPLLKDMRTAQKTIEEDLAAFRKIDSHITDVLKVAETKLDEAKKTYDLIKLMQDKVETRLVELIEQTKLGHELWAKMNDMMTSVSYNLPGQLPGVKR